MNMKYFGIHLVLVPIGYLSPESSGSTHMDFI